MPMTATQAQQLYVAYFNRPADVFGLDFWTKFGTVEAASADFAASAEYAATYANLTVAQRVDAIYMNLFGRPAEFDGLIYWVGEITAGKVSLSSAVTQIAGGALTTDLAAYNNKVTAATAFTTALNTNAEALAYQGTAANNAAKAWLSGVTNTASLTAATAPTALDATVASVTAAAVVTVEGAVLALTTGTDAFSTTASAATSRTTAGSDTINGVVQANGASGTTVAPGDSIDGGAGVDTLAISIAGTLLAGANDGAGDDTYTLSAVQTNGVEKVLVSNFDTNEADAARDENIIATDLMTGLTTVGMSASSASGDTNFTGLKNLVAAEMRNGAGDLTLTYNASVVSGTADTQNLTVSNLSAGTFTADGAETLSISTELVKSTLAAVASSTLKTINVAGSADLTITGATATTVTTINAGTLTGKLNVTSGVSDQKITGGSGDDTFNMVATLTTKDTVVGGLGADRLTLDGAALTTEFTNVSGVETVAYNVGGANVAMDVSKLSAGVTTVEMDLNDAGDDTTLITGTISNLDGQTVVLKHTVADAADAANNDGTAFTITGKLDTSADVVNVTLDAIGVTLDAANFGIGTLNVGNFETVNINSKASAAGAATTVTANAIRSVTDTSAKSIVVTGDADLTLTQTGTALTSLNASGLVGKLNVTLGANKVSVIGTGKDDTIAFAGNLNNDDTVDGGLGNDTLTTTSLTGLTSTTGALKIANVETINLSTNGNNTIALAGVTGVTALSVAANTQTITGLNLAATKLLLTANATVKVTGADETGANDTLTIEQKLDGDVTNVITAASTVENLALVLNDTNSGAGGAANTATFDLTDFAGKSVTVSESASTTTTGVNAVISTLNKSVTSVDTSGVKGTQTFSLANTLTSATVTLSGAAVATVTGTAVADTFNIKSTGAVVHAITGGGGSDTTNIDVKQGWVDPSGIATKTVNINVNAGDSVSLANTKAFNAASTTINVSGGNSVGTFSNIAQTNTFLADAVTIFNAATFGGKVTVGVANDVLDSTVTITGGVLATDTLTAVYATTGSYAPKISGIETLKISAGNDGTAQNFTLDLSGTTGVSTVEVNNIATTAVDTFIIDKIGTQKIVITGSALTGNIFETKLTDATGSSDSVSIEVKNAGGPTIVGTPVIKTTDIETINLKASGAATTVSLANLAMTDATKFETLVVTGDQALTVSALNANVTTIDASGMSTGGSFIQTGRSQTTAATYTGSLGADTFMMRNSADVIDGGAGTDTLNVSGNLILGGLQVDLNSTGDQITSYNGSSNAAVQKGFENINLSGLTGTFGADITAKSTGSTITGTANNDQIIGGAGTDIITGGLGADTITLGSATNALVFTSGSSQSTAYDIIEDLTDARVATTTITLADKGTEVGVTAGKLSATITALGGAANEAAAINLLLAGDGSTNGIVAWGVYNGNTYLAEDVSAGATAAAADIVIRFTGTLDLLAGTDLIVGFA